MGSKRRYRVTLIFTSEAELEVGDQEQYDKMCIESVFEYLFRAPHQSDRLLMIPGVLDFKLGNVERIDELVYTGPPQE